MRECLRELFLALEHFRLTVACSIDVSINHTSTLDRDCKQNP